jgi:hypothetical protein
MTGINMPALEQSPARPANPQTGAHSVADETRRGELEVLNTLSSTVAHV